MKVRNITWIAGIIGLGLLSTSCNSDEGSSESMVDLRKVEFSMTDEPFNEHVLQSRAGVSSQMPVQIVDLGNGLTAEVSADKDTPEEMPATRVAPLSDGKYYIYAVGSDGKRIKGDAKLVSGTVTAGVFKIDKGTSLNLPAGTYTFVCYNEHVQTDGDKLSFSIDNEKARVGVTTQTLTATPHLQKVSFAMKRQIARVRFKVTAYTTQAPNMKATLLSTADQPVKNSYTDLIKNPQSEKEAFSIPCTFPATTTDTNILAYDFFTPYRYYMSGVDGAQLKLHFSTGLVYGKSLANKDFVLSNLGKLEGNASYTVRIKLMFNPLYLFHDGTIGTYDERGTRTPIGIMIAERTKATVTEDEKGRGLAIALKNATLTDGDGNVTTNFMMTANGTSFNTEYSPYGSPDASFVYNDMKGYFWTWNKNGSVDNNVKAEDKEGCPGFYAAGHYNPGVTVTGQNVGKWFIPSTGQMMAALRKLKVADVKLSDWDSSEGMDQPIAADFGFATSVFNQVGGETLDKWIFTSTQHGDWGEFFALQPSLTNIYFAYRRNYEEWEIRPFVHF